MGNESGEWIMYGISDDDPACIHDLRELTARINRLGFLPFFKNSIPGFSVEENCNPDYWWSEDPVRDPWVWRQDAARQHRMAYGKFFGGKAGFISLRWLPAFVNYRRDGYDFDASWEDGLAKRAHKKIMDCFTPEKTEFFSYELKALAGFGRNGEKNFEGVMTSLQDKLYLVMSGFQCRLNKQGEEYGWNIARFSAPETLWGYERVTSDYRLPASDSYEAIVKRVRKICPEAEERDIRKLIGKAPEK